MTLSYGIQSSVKCNGAGSACRHFAQKQGVIHFLLANKAMQPIASSTCTSSWPSLVRASFFLAPAHFELKARLAASPLEFGHQQSFEDTVRWHT